MNILSLRTGQCPGCGHDSLRAFELTKWNGKSENLGSKLVFVHGDGCYCTFPAIPQLVALISKWKDLGWGR